MLINIKSVFNTSGMKKEINYEIPAEELTALKGCNFISPVTVKGTVFNRADVVYARFSTEFNLRLVCDRCLKEFEKTFLYEFEHIIVESLVNDDNDDYIIAENDSVDFNEVAVSDLLLKLPSKILCKDDCKGLCMVCGNNLNESECNCLSQ